MITAVGDLLPLALGIAISPVPIIAVILLLMSPRARTSSPAFLGGWVLGILVATAAFTALSSLVSGHDDEPAPLAAIVKVVAGLLLVLLAVRQWRSRPHGDDTPTLPPWMKAVDTMSVPAALGVGALLSAANPKNLLLAAAAGATLGETSLTAGETAVLVGAFTVVAATTVLLPVVGYLLASERLRGPLDRLREWLTRENATIMAVLLLVIGVTLCGKGLGSF